MTHDDENEQLIPGQGWMVTWMHDDGYDVEPVIAWSSRDGALIRRGTKLGTLGTWHDEGTYVIWHPAQDAEVPRRVYAQLGKLKRLHDRLGQDRAGQDQEQH